MKPIILAVALLLGGCGSSAFAQKTTPETQAVQLKEMFMAVSVNDDIDVVLTNSTTGELQVEGDLKSLRVHLNDGSLQLSKRYQADRPVKVYVPASYLSKVYMNGTGSLSSATVLSGQRIKVILAGESKIALKSKGNVVIETRDDIDFVESR